MKTFMTLAQALTLIALAISINVPTASAEKTSSQQAISKLYDNCQLANGTISKPADGRGWTCCTGGRCITCDHYCSVGDHIGIKNQNRQEAVGNTGTVQKAPKKKPLKDTLKQKAIKSKGTIAPSGK